MIGNNTSFSLVVPMRVFLLMYTCLAISSILKMRCLVSADAKMMGKSTNGAIRSRIAFSKVLITFWSLFSTRSPLVYNYYQTLIVSLNELEDIHILRLNSASGINHQNTHIRVLNTTNRTHNRIELKVFRNLVLAPNTSSINKVEVETKLIVACVNAVARCTPQYL